MSVSAAFTPTGNTVVITAAVDVIAVETIMTNIQWPKSPSVMASESASTVETISEEKK